MACFFLNWQVFFSISYSYGPFFAGSFLIRSLLVLFCNSNSCFASSYISCFCLASSFLPVHTMYVPGLFLSFSIGPVWSLSCQFLTCQFITFTFLACPLHWQELFPIPILIPYFLLTCQLLSYQFYNVTSWLFTFWYDRYWFFLLIFLFCTSHFLFYQFVT